MRSSDLADFSSWQNWNANAVSKAPSRPGVYAFRLAGSCFGRFKGESDLVYIGCAAKATIRSRLRTHLSDRSDSLDIAIRIRKAGAGQFEVAWKLVDSPQEAKSIEAELLRRYYRDHCELPPDNHSTPAKKIRRALEYLDNLSDKDAEMLLQKLASSVATPSPIKNT